MQTLQSESVLTPQEAQRLRELESIIQEGFTSFLKVGLAFAEVRFLIFYASSRLAHQESLERGRSLPLAIRVEVSDLW